MNERKRHVILTAKEIFREKGFTSSSIQNIIDEGGISKGTFYNYFSSKNEFLIEYMTFIAQDEQLRRNKLLIGEDVTDKSIFAQQILIRIDMYREYTLLPIFEFAVHSEDPLLKRFIQERYIKELNWLRERLVDLYGEEARPFTLDCAVMIVGIIQHMIYTWKASPNTMTEKIEAFKLVKYVVRRIDVIIKDVISSKDILLDSHILHKETSIQKVDLLHTINQLLDKLSPCLSNQQKEYLAFIQSELLSGITKPYILHSVVESLQKSISKQPQLFDVQTFSIDIKNYLNKKDE